MRKIKRPEFPLAEIVELCAGSVRDAGLSARLLAARAHLSAGEADYIGKATRGELYAIPVSGAAGDITQAEMSRLYNRTFVRANGPTRHIYDAIKLLAAGAICPLCNQRTVSTLDHHLSKQDYPDFAITPVNLVPACRDCNTDTLARESDSPQKQTFHPYFDYIEDATWLVASIEKTAPPVIKFAVSPPGAWDDNKRMKIEHHFETFRLGMLYSAHAAVELQNIYGELESIDKSGGANAMREELRQRFSSRAGVTSNNWQAAMYAALASSAWFCEGGYKSISPPAL